MEDSKRGYKAGSQVIVAALPVSFSLTRVFLGDARKVEILAGSDFIGHTTTFTGLTVC